MRSISMMLFSFLFCAGAVAQDSRLLLNQLPQQLGDITPSRREELKSVGPFVCQTVTGEEAKKRLREKPSLDPAQAAELRREDALRAEGRVPYALPSYSVSWCKDKQPTTFKLSITANPTNESNVLKSNTNIHADHSFGFGSTLLVTTGGFGAFDVVALSVGTASSRYDQFAAKNIDAITTQAVYQLFLRARGYDQAGGSFAIDPTTDKKKIPASNLITVDTFEIGVVNQASFKPTFQTRTADLLTPQVAYVRQNAPLFGTGPAQQCYTASKDFKKKGLCDYFDFAFTIGQSFSDVPTLENVNLQADLTLGHRFDQSDFRLTFKTSIIERLYENVPGGRNDVQYQFGSTLAYSPDPISTKTGSISTAFSLPVTYNINKSTVAASEWQGWVVMPTLTLAFAPPQ